MEKGCVGDGFAEIAVSSGSGGFLSLERAFWSAPVQEVNYPINSIDVYTVGMETKQTTTTWTVMLNKWWETQNKRQRCYIVRYAGHKTVKHLKNIHNIHLFATYTLYHLYIDSYGTTSILFYCIYLHYFLCFIVLHCWRSLGPKMCIDISTL